LIARLLGASCLVALVVCGIASGTATGATVQLTLTAAAGPGGTVVAVTAPGCQPSPPGSSEIVVQGRSSTGEIGEGAVATGGFTSVGHGSVTIPAATPISGFLLRVTCNGGTITGSQAFTLTQAATPILSPINLTG
jgi:hypothetical protein